MAHTPFQQRRIGVLAFVALLLATPAAAHAQRDNVRLDTTVALAKGGSVHLALVSGDIRVVGTARDDVHIVASIERGRLETTFTPNRIAISARSVDSRLGSGRYDLTVPVGTRVTATSVSGSIEIVATQGEVVARSVSGDVRVRDATGRVEAAAVSGDVGLVNVSGQLRVETVSGEITVENGSGEITAESVSGSVLLRRSRFDGIRANSVSAGISYDGPFSDNGSYRLNSHSGSIALTLPADVGAALELETFSGRITSDFPLTLQPGEGTGRRNRRMEFSLGNGRARVIAETFSGNITIRRSTATGNQE